MVDKNQSGLSKLDHVQQRIDEVVLVMHDNVNKVLERDIKLEEIQDKAEDLKEGADRFHRTSKQLKRKMLYQNTKVTMMMVLLIIIIVVTLVLVLGN